MKRYQTPITLMAMGLLLLGKGLLFRFLDLPDGLYGLYSGPAVIIVGIIVLSIIRDKPINDTTQIPKSYTKPPTWTSIGSTGMTMKQLSSGQTFLTKYFATAMWAFIPITTAITVYNKFGQVEGFYMIPISVIPMLLSYMPMKISYSDTNIIVSDLFKKEEYKFEDIKSLEYVNSTIQYHPYWQLKITTTDNSIRKIKFMARTSDAFKSLFKKGLQGRPKELIDLWTHHTTVNKSLQ